MNEVSIGGDERQREKTLESLNIVWDKMKSENPESIEETISDALKSVKIDL